MSEVELRAELQPPMSNGEVVFAEPWQGRVFGMAVALTEAGVFSWAEFQASLIAVIGQWDRWAAARSQGEVGEYEYYDLFRQALDRLLAERSVVTAAELAQRCAEYAARPHDHDHHHHDDHGHHHDHDHDHPH